MSPIIDKVIKQLKKTKLSQEDRLALTTAILNSLSVLPIDDAIVISPDGIKINGKSLDIEQIVQFTESCKALKDNKARQIITEQVKFLAINMGVHQALSMDMMMFSKSALWNIQQIETLLDKIV